jgi:pimeloyl-ACP methyl ester carboxylesterase
MIRVSAFVLAKEATEEDRRVPANAPHPTDAATLLAEVIEMATFVLVHGAFGSPAELAPVIPWLEALGHRAIAVDLPCTDPAATLDDYARTVVEAMDGTEGPVTVVGHSAGGATISLVPGRARVDRLVYVTAVVPEPGRSIADVVGASVRETMLSVSRDDGNGCRSFDLELLASLAPPEQREAYLAFLQATQRPQGWAALEEPWPGRSLPDVPRTYVLCTEDTIIPPARQREMAARLGVEPIAIASDHSVFALQPRELAAVLTAQQRST